MHNEFEPVRFVIETRSPVVVTEFAPQFDALIYEALCQVSSLAHDDILNRMKDLVKYNDELGVFHASSMRFGITPESGLVPKHYVRVDSHIGKFRSEHFSANGGRGVNLRYIKVPTSGGDYKVRINSRLAYESPFVCFDALCDADNVIKLLNSAFIGIGYDGFRAGQGEIKRISSIVLSEDCSLSVNNKAKRNLPNTTPGISGEESLSPLLPPYFKRETRQPCFSAPRIDVIAKNQLTQIV